MDLEGVPLPSSGTNECSKEGDEESLRRRFFETGESPTLKSQPKIQLGCARILLVLRLTSTTASWTGVSSGVGTPIGRPLSECMRAEPNCAERAPLHAGGQVVNIRFKRQAVVSPCLAVNAGGGVSLHGQVRAQALDVAHMVQQRGHPSAHRTFIHCTAPV
jgi:hypothetical protein